MGSSGVHGRRPAGWPSRPEQPDLTTTRDDHVTEARTGLDVGRPDRVLGSDERHTGGRLKEP
jgi:hypothetical protein